MFEDLCNLAFAKFSFYSILKIFRYSYCQRKKRGENVPNIYAKKNNFYLRTTDT